MHQTKKGAQWYFGMKAHMGVDASSGLVHTVVTTAANEADVNIADELLHGKEQTVYADASYTGWQTSAIPRKAASGTLRSSAASSRRWPKEGAQKDQLKAAETSKAGFKGLVKNTSQIVMLFALGNLRRARRRLLGIKEQQQQNKQPKAVVRLKAD
jgi:transposase, IS5 family